MGGIGLKIDQKLIAEPPLIEHPRYA